MRVVLWLLSAGNLKVVLVVVAALAASWISWTMIQSGKEIESLKNDLERQADYIEVRKKIDNATRKIPADTSANAVRERLRQRQATQSE